MKTGGWLLIVVMLACAVFCHAGEPIIIVSDDYQPYTSSKNGGSGVILDIVKQVFDEIHIETVFKFYPWKRCEAHVAKGIAFAAVPYFKTEARLGRYDFSDPVIYSFNRFFFNKEKFPKGFEWNTLEDFRGYTMGSILGYWYMPAFERAGLRTEAVASDLQNMEKLIHRRIDFTLVDELTGRWLLREYFSKETEKIRMLEKPESFIEFYLLISRTYPNSAGITERFNNGLRMLKENGGYRKILEDYNIPEHYAAP